MSEERTAQQSDGATEAMEDVLHEVFDTIENRGQRGIETGLIELDWTLNGLRRREMIVLGSRTSMGKSALAANFLEHMTVDSGIPCAAFLLEMDKQQYAQRLLCSRARIDSHKMRSGMLSADEYVRLADTVGEVAKAPLYVQSVPGIYLDELCELIDETVRKRGVLVVLVDYVQLIEAEGDNRTEQLTVISRRLKALAMRLNIALIAVSQLNRGMFQSEAPRPRFEDLRGSGTLEDEADVILLLHREDYYRMSQPDFVPDNLADIIVAKQRNGPTGACKVLFNNKCVRFENFSTTADPF
jgi:replicative DNA helicase